MFNMMNATKDTARHIKDSAREGMEQAMDSAKHAVGSAKTAVGSAKTEADHAFSKVLSGILTGVKTVAEVTAVLRALRVNDALGWVGLRRRRDPFMGLALFGAGLTVGAGVGMLFAPMSGRDLRRAILSRFSSASDDAKEPRPGVESEMKDVENKAEPSVQAAGGTAKDAVQGTKSASGGAVYAAAGNGHR